LFICQFEFRLDLLHQQQAGNATPLPWKSASESAAKTTPPLSLGQGHTRNHNGSYKAAQHTTPQTHHLSFHQHTFKFSGHEESVKPTILTTGVAPANNKTPGLGKSFSRPGVN
jgi:hypothetical protein